MKASTTPQSATSVPAAPRDESRGRMRRYTIMMSVRAICFILMVVVRPYGWLTLIFAVGAIVLPYIAVVVANVGSATRTVAAVPPERTLDTAAPDHPEDTTSHPTVLRIQESPAATPPTQEDRPQS